MTTMSPHDRLMAALKRGTPDRVPFSPFMIRWIRYRYGCTCPNHQTKVAQELELTRPDLVRDITFTYTEQIFDGEATTTATTTETTKFVTLPSIWEMVKAIQELDAKQQDLEARVEVLEGKSLTAIGSTSPLAGLWAGIASLFARLIINLS